MTATRLFAAFAVSAAMCAPALAQTAPKPKTKPIAVITHYTPANVVKALTELGVTDAAARKQSIGNGQTVDVVSFSNGGLKHVGILTACSAPGCLGIQFLTVWGDQAGKQISRVALNSYNANYIFGKGFIGPNSSLVYSRYTISDGGVSADNLKSNISNFANGSQTFIRALSSAPRGTEANATSGEANVHAASQNLSAEVEGVIMDLGTSQGLNALSIQSSPIPDAPASEPAQ
jgi:hypothetical protein